MHPNCNLVGPMRWWSLVEEPQKTLWCHWLPGLCCYVFNALLPRGLQSFTLLVCMSTHVLGYWHISTTLQCIVPTAFINTLRIYCMDEALCNTAVQCCRCNLYAICDEFSIQQCSWSHAKKPARCKSISFFKKKKHIFWQKNHTYWHTQTCSISTPWSLYALLFLNIIQYLHDLKCISHQHDSCPIYAEYTGMWYCSQPRQQTGWCRGD